MTARKSRRFFLTIDILIPMVLFVATVLTFRFTNLDLVLQKTFYHVDTGWFLKNNSLIKFLYHYGNVPALILSIGGLVLLGMSFYKSKWVKWRKVGLFLLLAMILAPGLIINTVLKQNWGRPRPRNTQEFGGKYRFEQVLSIDKTSPGYSFPCGHASMGFYLFITWFLLRRKNTKWATISMLSGITLGLAIGWARVAQGGHYTSDVIVAGITVYAVGAILYYVMRFDRALWFYSHKDEIDRKQRVIVVLILSVTVFFLILGVVLATPYSKSGHHSATKEDLAIAKSSQLDLDIYAADLKLIYADSISIAFDTQGFGYPRSKLKGKFHSSLNLDTLSTRFAQTKKGFFTELDNKVTVTYPFACKDSIHLTLQKGSSQIVLPDSLDKLKLYIKIINGTLDLDLPEAYKPVIKLKGDFDLEDKTGFTSNDKIYVNDNFRVNIIVVKGKVILH
jgi:membrane-associated PAP2 superfamily phosphatase